MQEAIIESKFEYKGHTCLVVLRFPGYRCGYISIPKGKAINTDYISCHGGITFSGDELNPPVGNENSYWIGFDCAHYGDGYDEGKAFDTWKSENEVNSLNIMFMVENFKPKSLAYCEQECKNIVEQIIRRD